MPILAAFLDSRSDQLQDTSVDVVLRLASMRILSQAIAGAGDTVATLGALDVLGGAARLAVAAEMGSASDAMAQDAADLAATGLDEIAIGTIAREAAISVATEEG
jgi:hypothetical protein